MSAIGFFSDPGPLTIDGARAGLCSFLLAHQSGQLPVLLSEVTPALGALQWLGVSWQAPAPQTLSKALLDSLSVRGLLYPCGCAVVPSSHECPQRPPAEIRGYRLRLSGVESLRYQDEAHHELALHAEDPVVAGAEMEPSPALILAQRALVAEVSTLVTQPQREAVGVLLAALRILETKTPLRILLLPALESYEALPTIQALREQGYLPTAVANALILLFWAPPGGVTALSTELMLLLYEPSHPAPAARFELARLRMLNEAHIRALSFEELGEALRPFLEERRLFRPQHSLLQWAKLAREEITTLRDVEHLAYFVERELAGPTGATEEILAIMRADTVAPVLAEAARYFAEGDADFHVLRARIEQQTNIRRKKLFYPLRIALTGKIYGPSFPEVLPFLGAEECLQRVARWREFLAS